MIDLGNTAHGYYCAEVNLVLMQVKNLQEQLRSTNNLFTSELVWKKLSDKHSNKVEDRRWFPFKKPHKSLK
jgi:hypothetical protein